MDNDIRMRLTRQMAMALLEDKNLDLHDRDACINVASRRYHWLTMAACLDDARTMATIRRANDQRSR